MLFGLLKLSTLAFQGWTLLHVAAEHDRIDVARQLLKAGALANTTDAVPASTTLNLCKSNTPSPAAHADGTAPCVLQQAPSHGSAACQAWRTRLEGRGV